MYFNPYSAQVQDFIHDQEVKEALADQIKIIEARYANSVTNAIYKFPIYNIEQKTNQESEDSILMEEVEGQYLYQLSNQNDFKEPQYLDVLRQKRKKRLQREKERILQPIFQPIKNTGPLPAHILEPVTFKPQKMKMKLNQVIGKRTTADNFNINIKSHQQLLKEARQQYYQKNKVFFVSSKRHQTIKKNPNRNKPTQPPIKK